MTNVCKKCKAQSVLKRVSISLFSSAPVTGGEVGSSTGLMKWPSVSVSLTPELLVPEFVEIVKSQCYTMFYCSATQEDTQLGPWRIC